MILFPAIDIKDGVCVRLQQGDMARATVFNHDPASQAQSFEAEGFEYLHVVDLDAAFAGRPVNVMAVERIIESVPLPVQLGGGLRDMAVIAGWLEKGVDRAIIGTAAVRDPALVKAAARAFPGRIAVGLDARDGKVAVQGWAESSELSALEIARRFEDAGVAAIIYTDISRDGLLNGPQSRRHHRAGGRHCDPGDRVGWPRLPRRHPQDARAARRQAGRRHRRPRPL